MNITKTTKGNDLILSLSGRIDTITQIQLSNEIDKILNDEFNNLFLDFGEVVYVSSAGIRVIIETHKKITSRGYKLELTNMNDTVKNIFDITGISNIISITLLIMLYKYSLINFICISQPAL
jgi:anti-sigma B factor antagonist